MPGSRLASVAVRPTPAPGSSQIWALGGRREIQQSKSQNSFRNLKSEGVHHGTITIPLKLKSQFTIRNICLDRKNVTQAPAISFQL